MTTWHTYKNHSVNNSWGFQLLGCPKELGSMVCKWCILVINGVYWGYNPFTNPLLTSWDIQVPTSHQTGVLFARFFLIFFVKSLFGISNLIHGGSSTQLQPQTGHLFGAAWKRFVAQASVKVLLDKLAEAMVPLETWGNSWSCHRGFFCVVFVLKLQKHLKLFVCLFCLFCLFCLICLFVWFGFVCLFVCLFVCFFWLFGSCVLFGFVVGFELLMKMSVLGYFGGLRISSNGDNGITLLSSRVSL